MGDLHEKVQTIFTKLIKTHMEGATDEDFRERMDLLITAMGGKNNCYFTCIQNAPQPCLQACQQGCLATCGDRGPRPIELDDFTKMPAELLSKFRADESGIRDITNADRIALVREARTLFSEFYAHLDLKKAMLAIDPVGRCNALLREVERSQAVTDLPHSEPIPGKHYCDLDFFHDLLAIFTELRDAHTSLTLPDKYSNRFAHLPFTVQEYYEPGDPEPRTLVTAVSGDFGSFKPGVEIYCWNELPICRKISDVANLTPGANRLARRRMAADMLTTRWLGQMPMPDEDAVTIKYKSIDDKELTIYMKWHVYTNNGPDKYIGGASIGHVTGETAFRQGVNKQALEVQRARYRLFKKRLLPAAKKSANSEIAPIEGPETDDATIYNPIKAIKPAKHTLLNVDAGTIRLPDAKGREYGYLGIRNFDVGDAVQFATDILDILKQLPQDRLIIDLRGNPGGLIPAGELLLQLFTKEPIQTAPVRFRSTEVTKNLVLSMPAILKDWGPSLKSAAETGAQYSAAFPITPKTMLDSIPHGAYLGEIALIVDAMTYSTGDFFAAGFRDNKLGSIVGTDHTTGAGGAARWEHDQLLLQVRKGENPLRTFPADLQEVQMSIAIQGATRADGPLHEMPFEGLGVEVCGSCLHLLTKDDLTTDGVDLLGVAAKHIETGIKARSHKSK